MNRNRPFDVPCLWLVTSDGRKEIDSDKKEEHRARDAPSLAPSLTAK